MFNSQFKQQIRNSRKEKGLTKTKRVNYNISSYCLVRSQFIPQLFSIVIFDSLSELKCSKLTNFIFMGHTTYPLWFDLITF